MLRFDVRHSRRSHDKPLMQFLHIVAAGVAELCRIHCSLPQEKNDGCLFQQTLYRAAECRLAVKEDADTFTLYLSFFLQELYRLVQALALALHIGKNDNLMFHGLTS